MPAKSNAIIYEQFSFGLLRAGVKPYGVMVFISHAYLWTTGAIVFNTL